ncbi:Death domain associated protein [Melia azedarach]|uniref:Death domain associated protein n=1 Tax=Melia azedarach TaxID=155640 RepID=A0ACC1YX53_MELAZ|nr:Death domain associated protein [Melia azedarach]
MWAVSPIPSAPFLSTPTRQSLLRSLSRSNPPKNDGDGAYHEDMGGLGHRHTHLTNLNPSTRNSIPVSKRQKQKKADGKQLSGSDVLWALQRAAAMKRENKKSKKRREVSSANTYREDKNEDDDVDYSNVKPLCIKAEWAAKLDDLEKRLQELSEFE